LQACDRYKDILPVFISGLRQIEYFDKYYIATDTDFWSPSGIPSHDGDYCVIQHLNKDYGWSKNIIKLLEVVREDVFFMGCEDYILEDFAKEEIDICFKAVCKDKDIGCIRLTRKKRIKLENEFEDDIYGPVYGPIVKPYPYYVSLQPTIWKKSYLRSIIKEDENAWQFETEASKRAMQISTPRAYCTSKTLFNYKNYIVKGQLQKNPPDYRSIHDLYHRCVPSAQSIAGWSFSRCI